MRITVVGGGLAGSEAALYLAEHGVEVTLYEMRPKISTGAHTGEDFAEFVCSNSLGSIATTNASGLLKFEGELLGSKLLRIAKENAVPSGNSLSVDRAGFSRAVTEIIKNHPKIKVVNEEYNEINLETPVIIATGPLTSQKLVDGIKKLTGEDNFHFFDAIAPIVVKDSIDFNSAFYASRWDKGEADFINCPLNKDEYEEFYNILTTAERAPLKDFEAKFFEGCLPVEILASRGKDTLRFGPMKPVGLRDSRHKDGGGEKFCAVVQLRQDDKIASLYNLVGFQTNLKWGEQKRLIQSIPALRDAQIVRYGVMHANTFINSPKILESTLQSKISPNLFFAGQLTGVEGYCESIVTGLFAAINTLNYINGESLVKLPPKTMLGALLEYITYAEHKTFQPINSNWGIVEPMELDKKTRKNKELKNSLLAQRSIDYFKDYLKSAIK